jgi:hypothetical protein
MESKAILCSFELALRGENLRLPDRGSRLNIDDDRVVDVDQKLSIDRKRCSVGTRLSSKNS